MADGLTNKQRSFVDNYLIDLNAKQAAVRAGYSAKTAQEQGSYLLSNVKVQAEIALAMERRSQQTQIDAARVLQEIALLAFSDITHYIKQKNNTLTLEEFKRLPPGASRVIKKIKQKPVELILDEKMGMGEPTLKTEYVVEIELWDKPKSLDMLCKHLGMFLPRPDADLDNENNPDPLIEAMTSSAQDDWNSHEPESNTEEPEESEA